MEGLGCPVFFLFFFFPQYSVIFTRKHWQGGVSVDAPRGPQELLQSCQLPHFWPLCLDLLCLIDDYIEASALNCKCWCFIKAPSGTSWCVLSVLVSRQNPVWLLGASWLGSVALIWPLLLSNPTLEIVSGYCSLETEVLFYRLVVMQLKAMVTEFLSFFFNCFKNLLINPTGFLCMVMVHVLKHSACLTLTKEKIG